MSYPDEVPILSPEECKDQLEQLFRNIFPSAYMPEVIGAFAHVHCTLLPQKRRGVLQTKTPHTKAILVNVTTAYLGYTDGHSDHILSLLSKVQTKCRRKIWFEKSPFSIMSYPPS
jgi:hypothetical protein